MGMFVPFTGNELYSILSLAKQDYYRTYYVLKADVRSKDVPGMGALIARDMKELARIRKLIAHIKQQLKEARILHEQGEH